MGASYAYTSASHDDAIKWKHFPRYWPFVRGIHRSPVNSPHESQWRGALMFLWFMPWINGWANNREAGVLRRQHANYDVIVCLYQCQWSNPNGWVSVHVSSHMMTSWLCEGYPPINGPINGGFHKGPVMRSVEVFFNFDFNCWINSRNAADSRRHGIHIQDVTVMIKRDVVYMLHVVWHLISPTHLAQRNHQSCAFVSLTHWGRVTHICVGNLTIIGSDNGLSPGRRQAII